MAGILWVLSGMVLPALLHTFEHGVALWLSDSERRSSEVGAEEISEGWHGGSGSGGGTNSHHVGPSVWSWWNEEGGIVEAESLHVWVLEEPCAHGETTLERMASNHEWMCVI